MQIESDIFQVKDSNESFETWISKDFVSNNIRPDLRKSSILVLPTIGFRDRNDPNFPVGTEEFLAYCKRVLPAELVIDVCIDENKYLELALHSNYKRIGKFLVNAVALTIFLNVLSSYIYDSINKIESSKPQIQIVNIANSKKTIINPDDANAPKKYMESPKVKFSITVVDSAKLKSKEFHYEGPAENVEEITEQIKQLWDDDNK